MTSALMNLRALIICKGPDGRSDLDPPLCGDNPRTTLSTA